MTFHQLNWRRNLVRAVPGTLLILCAVSHSSVVDAQSDRPIFGTAQAQDGDSLEINGVRIRLHGIDAPEFDQTCRKGQTEWACGAEAADNLSRLVTGREVRCTNLGKDQYDRILGRCTVNGMDVNSAVVERGHAMAFRKYSTDYVGAEERAKAAGRGIWAGSFEEPGKVRAGSGSSINRRAKSGSRPRAQSSVLRTGGCVIKGNKSRRGDWIYHLPGMPYYNETRAEAMFCTEAEARAAGYRRSRAR